MLLVIDVGNTNMEFGVYRGEELVGSFRLMTDANRTSDELGLWLCQYFQRFGLELGQVEDVVIGSVAPQVMHTLSRAVQKYVGKTPLVLDEALDPGLPTWSATATSAWAPTGRRRISRPSPSTARRWWCWTSERPPPWTR